MQRPSKIKGKKIFILRKCLIPLSRTYSHGSKGVRAIEVLLYKVGKDCKNVSHCIAGRPKKFFRVSCASVPTYNKRA